MKKFFLVGNWKAHGCTKDVKNFLHAFKSTRAKKLKTIEVLLALPLPYLRLNKDEKADLESSNIELSAQNISSFSNGSYTGEVTCEMLKDLDVSWSIVGHSERRRLLNESTATLTQKLLRAQEVGVSSILCFGEEIKQDYDTVAKNLFEGLYSILLPLSDEFRQSIILAYEPYWAIGKKESASRETIQEVLSRLQYQLLKKFGHPFIFLYGGSVDEYNLASILCPIISGFLVGSASLDGKRFGELTNLLSQNIQEAE